MTSIIPINQIELKIHTIRGHRVMLAQDIAVLYGVPTKRINEQVRRNKRRFPIDFMFQLTWEEAMALRSQIATLDASVRGRHAKYRPIAFTEQGVAMLSSVLNSERAIDVNVAIMRAFVKLRALSSRDKELSRKLDELERKSEVHDVHIRNIFESIRGLMNPPLSKKRQIGFKPA